eukprot:TRINITY_DN3324_c0_g2_i1.p1 TRINITY_DN3324_c0_g2~~TRINITY_DN3324_c0_g2_i1.p1  ORF type:complete len:366 (-),score=33.43 TRINITY_DN3324_c0_g2_i1:251-1255(-)
MPVSAVNVIDLEQNRYRIHLHPQATALDVKNAVHGSRPPIAFLSFLFVGPIFLNCRIMPVSAVNVIDLEQNRYRIHLHPQATALDVKNAVHGSGGPPVEQQRLIYRGRLVVNTAIIDEVVQGEEDKTLHLVVGTPPAPAAAPAAQRAPAGAPAAGAATSAAASPSASTDASGAAATNGSATTQGAATAGAASPIAGLESLGEQIAGVLGNAAPGTHGEVRFNINLGGGAPGQQQPSAPAGQPCVHVDLLLLLLLLLFGAGTNGVGFHIYFLMNINMLMMTLPFSLFHFWGLPFSFLFLFCPSPSQQHPRRRRAICRADRRAARRRRRAAALGAL